MVTGNFFSELKRRNIYRVGAAYAVAAFVLIEVISNVAPVFDLPGWIARAVILLLIVGFPAVLTFAWVYEVTPDGLKRTADVEKDASVTHQTGHRLNIVIIGLIVVLAVLYATDRFLLPQGAAEDVARTTAEGPAGSVSIAVLPFVNLSGDASQEFFSDGMTEEITSALAKVPSLTVMGRTSAFEFKGQNKDLRAIGQALGVRYLLEGSVRKSGSRVRITGQLIRADSGAHVWTENYDRELIDIFATQDDIARAIAAALHAPLGLAAGRTLVAGRALNPETYQMYLRGKALFRARGTISNPLTTAVGLLERVLEQAPDFAPAWALLAAVYANAPQEMPTFREGSVEERRAISDQYLSKAESAGLRAIALDPQSADSYAGLANAKVFRRSYFEMEDLYRQALKLDPHNPDALHGLSQQLVQLGRMAEGSVLRRQLMELEPLVPRFNRDAGNLLAITGETEAALAVFKALPTDFRERAQHVARTHASLGQYKEAADAVLSAPTGTFPPGEAEAAARLLRIAPAHVSAEELPDLSVLIFAYLHVGATDRFVNAQLAGMERSMAAGSNALGPYVLNDASFAPVRKTERFKALVREIGLVEYWRARGWPDVCHPVGADDFECD